MFFLQPKLSSLDIRTSFGYSRIDLACRALEVSKNASEDLQYTCQCDMEDQINFTEDDVKAIVASHLGTLDFHTFGHIFWRALYYGPCLRDLAKKVKE